jgi:hypothetical protein
MVCGGRPPASPDCKRRLQGRMAVSQPSIRRDGWGSPGPNPDRPTTWAYDGVPGEDSIPVPLPPPANSRTVGLSAGMSLKSRSFAKVFLLENSGCRDEKPFLGLREWLFLQTLYTALAGIVLDFVNP